MADDARLAWESPYPFQIYLLDPASDADWDDLYNELSRGADRLAGELRPLRRVLEVAREHQVETIVAETRYIDLDYRSEFSAFYSKAFESFHDSCRRLHFFSTELDETAVLSLRQDQIESYVGYVVLRPQVRATVGRTMLQPPPSLKYAVRTAVNEAVTFFGQSLKVRAVPFMQQDARLGRCAHVAIWMCHYSAVRGERRVARQPVAHFSLTTDSSLALGRAVPSKGLNLHQMSDVLTRSGLPSIYYDVADLSDLDRPDGDNWLERPDDPADRAARVACRYCNSGVPIVAVTRLAPEEDGAPPDFDTAPLHAVVICGYRRVADGVCLIGHDDRRGPYLQYEKVFDSFDAEWMEHARIEHLLAPVPDKVWLSGEAAERAGSEYLVEHARNSVGLGIDAARVIVERFETGRLGFRAYATNASRFKRRIADHIDDETVVAAYRAARFPHYVWVVEAVDRDLREDDAVESVLGEVVYDATSDDRDPIRLAARVPGLIAVARPRDPLWNQRTDFVRPVASSGQNRP